MAILVNFFAGDLNAVRRCLDSGGWPTELPASKFDGDVGFIGIAARSVDDGAVAYHQAGGGHGGLRDGVAESGVILLSGRGSTCRHSRGLAETNLR